MWKLSKRIALATAVAAVALPAPAAAKPASKPLATLFKNPQCGCCEGYADYLRSNGYQVKVIPSNDLPLIQHRQGVPAGLEGCHETLIGGYFIDGHVAIKDVNRLLAERPNINGITLPGMPMGTPGMGGQKMGPLKIYAVAKGGRVSTYAVD